VAPPKKKKKYGAAGRAALYIEQEIGHPAGLCRYRLARWIHGSNDEPSASSKSSYMLARATLQAQLPSPTGEQYSRQETVSNNLTVLRAETECQDFS